MTQKARSKGFSLLAVIVVVLVIAAVGVGGWVVAQHNKAEKSISKSDPKNSGISAQGTTVTTQGGAFSIQIPHGWRIIKYPGDFLGSPEALVESATPPTIETSATEYVGHSLRFSAALQELDDAGLGPFWASPQPGLEEFSEDFSIGQLQGKRNKGIFSGDIHETVYQYIFDVGDGMKLEIVYRVNHSIGEKDEVTTVERVIKTIKLKFP